MRCRIRGRRRTSGRKERSHLDSYYISQERRERDSGKEEEKKQQLEQQKQENWDCGGEGEEVGGGGGFFKTKVVERSDAKTFLISKAHTAAANATHALVPPLQRSSLDRDDKKRWKN